MKIRILPVAPAFQPEDQPFRYPGHSVDYYTVEQDFLVYLQQHPELVSETGDWAYLPIFWTRWHLQHDYAVSGLLELQAEVDRLIDDAPNTFTICQYDDGPIVDMGETIVFLASRTTPQGRDIPLLCAPHLSVLTAKQYRAGFLGRLSTHPIRQAMASCLAHRADVTIQDSDAGEARFVELLSASHIALCPRGYGGGSFRFYEAMQLGVVPLMLSDIDTRPFKQAIDWDRCSLFVTSATEVESVLDRFDDETLCEMGRHASDTYWSSLSYQQWCPFVLQELG